MNKRSSVFFLIILLFPICFSYAQVSHGGKPLPLNKTRSATSDLFKEMPLFDLKEELRLDSLNETDLKGGYKFGYKFMTDFNQFNAGTSFFLPDGTRVWRLGIRSKGALSINIQFAEYSLPEGAQLFLYNSTQTQVLGSFTHQNNSELGILPVAPIYGDELIIEYHEPAFVPFQGKLTIGEVNHGYKDLRGSEPMGDKSSFLCMPAVACFTEGEKYDDIERSVVVMIIDGTTACSGVMVNNTSNDGTPYVLTASHCLNGLFTVDNPNYAKVAGSIVFFFNFNSPSCTNIMRGTEEMSVASAICNGVNEKSDLAILQLLESPPVYYRPYYAGWNISDTPTPPFSAIHHPGGSIKRISISDNTINIKSFTLSSFNFTPNAHWYVKQWTVGCTAGGSSGSPLFDSENRIVGILSGGSSSCERPTDDYYLALSKSWNPEVDENQQLQHWLNPSKTKDITTCNGLDPYRSIPCIRLSNIKEAKASDKIEITSLPAAESGYLFGVNSIQTEEYAEEYYLNGTATLFGTYLVTPLIADNLNDLDVTVSVYSGTDKPETVLHTEQFRPTYTNKVIYDDSFQETEKRLNRNQESFINFDKLVRVSGRIFIGYKIKMPTNSTFSVYNATKEAVSKNTAWIKFNQKWIKTPDHPLSPFSTSLYIDPVIQYTTLTSSQKMDEVSTVLVAVVPNQKIVYIKLPAGFEKGIVTLYSLNGQTIMKKKIHENQSYIQASSLNSGSYLIQIDCKNKLYTQKIVL